MNQVVRAWIIVACVLWLGSDIVFSFPVYAKYKDIGFYSIAMFLFLTIIIQVISPILARHPNRQFFLSASIYNMLVKMACSFGLLFWYKQHRFPVDGNFVVPFLFIYLVFTIFETWYLMRLAYDSPK